MNKEWSQLNKTMQMQLKKEITFPDGINTLLKLRKEMMKEVESWLLQLTKEDFSAMPFMNADGFHSKTIAYSLWHIFRIEDIVVHALICNDTQIFIAGGYQKKIGSPIITTGNELVKEQIVLFSKQLDLEALYQYIRDVGKSTEHMLERLSYEDLKMKFTDHDKERIRALNVVSTDQNAYWLIDYWCGKNVRGLLQMPFSRHWIMHIEASLRIKNKLTI